MRKKFIVAGAAAMAAVTSLAANAHGGFHHGHPYAHELWQLGLTPTEVSSIQQIYHSAHDQLRAQFMAVHQARTAYETATPGTAAFQTAEASLAQAVASAASAAVQEDASERAQIYAVLSQPQQTQLLALIAQHASHQHGPPPE